MTDARVGRRDPTTAQGRAPATELAGGRAPPVFRQRVPASGQSLFGFVGLRLPPLQAPEDQAPLAEGESGHGRFPPLSGLRRGARVRSGHPRAIRGTVVIIEPLPCVGQQGLDRCPSPLGPLPDDAQAPRRCRHDAGLWALREGCAEGRLGLPLRPTAPRDEARAISQGEATALRVTPRPPPLRALGALVPGPCPWLPGPGRPCRPRGAIQPPYQPGAPGASGRDGGAARSRGVEGCHPPPSAPPRWGWAPWASAHSPRLPR